MSASARENGGGPEPGFGERLGRLGSSLRDLVATRLAMFREEAAEKREHLAAGLAALAIAGALAVLAALLLTAAVAALLARLFGSALAGIFATFVLYALLAAAAGVFGARRLSRVRPLEFPVTGPELAGDLQALRAAARAPAPEPEPSEEPAADEDEDEEDESLEARFRERSE